MLNSALQSYRTRTRIPMQKAEACNQEIQALRLVIARLEVDPNGSVAAMYAAQDRIDALRVEMHDALARC